MVRITSRPSGVAATCCASRTTATAASRSDWPPIPAELILHVNADWPGPSRARNHRLVAPIVVSTSVARDPRRRGDDHERSAHHARRALRPAAHHSGAEPRPRSDGARPYADRGADLARADRDSGHRPGQGAGSRLRSRPWTVNSLRPAAAGMTSLQYPPDR